jgi:hypothetical protein
MAVSQNQIRAKGQKTDKDGKLKHCYQGVKLKDEVERKEDLEWAMAPPLSADATKLDSPWRQTP